MFSYKCKSCGAPLSLKNVFGQITCDHCGLTQRFFRSTANADLLVINNVSIGSKEDLVDLVRSAEDAYKADLYESARREAKEVLVRDPGNLKGIRLLLLADARLNMRERGISFYIEFLSDLYVSSDTKSQEYVFQSIFTELIQTYLGLDYNSEHTNWDGVSVILKVLDGELLKKFCLYFVEPYKNGILKSLLYRCGYARSPKEKIYGAVGTGPYEDEVKAGQKAEPFSYFIDSCQLEGFIKRRAPEIIKFKKAFKEHNQIWPNVYFYSEDYKLLSQIETYDQAPKIDWKAFAVREGKASSTGCCIPIIFGVGLLYSLLS